MKSKQHDTFNAQAFLDSAGLKRTIVEYRRGEVIFTQGDPCEHVLYIQKGGVKLSVLSKAGQQAVVAMLGPGEFFGEGCLAGQPVRMGSATATADSAILLVGMDQMGRMLHAQHALSDRFITHMLTRNIRIEQDLVDQLFNPSEKRLARTLLLLARYGEHDKPVRAVPPISQETLAEMIGTTRSRVNFFMKKFQRLGFIDYKDGLKVNNSLFTVVLHDQPIQRASDNRAVGSSPPAIRAAQVPPVGLAIYSLEKRSNNGNTHLRQRQPNVRNHAVENSRGDSRRKRLIVDRRARI